MSTGILFVTAPEADHRAVNLLLHELSNWGYNDGQPDFKVITTKNAYDFELPPDTSVLEPTPPSLDSTFTNAWAGSSLKDVEDFCLDVLRDEETKNAEPSLFVVVDSAGFEAREAILVERGMDDETDELVYLDSFVKMRIPWGELNSIWTNLDIANMSFEEFCEDEEDDEEEEEEAEGRAEEEEDAENAVQDEEVGNGWFKYHSSGPDLLSEKDAKRKEKAFQRLKKDGRI